MTNKCMANLRTVKYYKQLFAWDQVASFANRLFHCQTVEAGYV